MVTKTQCKHASKHSDSYQILQKVIRTEAKKDKVELKKDKVELKGPENYLNDRESAN